MFIVWNAFTRVLHHHDFCVAKRKPDNNVFGIQICSVLVIEYGPLSGSDNERIKIYVDTFILGSKLVFRSVVANLIQVQNIK